MCMNVSALGYIDPNTSQHVFSLLGPILALLAATGGLAVTVVVFVRHRITTYFRNASWATRVATVSIVTGVLVVASVAICMIIW